MVDEKQGPPTWFYYVIVPVVKLSLAAFALFLGYQIMRIQPVTVRLFKIKVISTINL